MVNDKKWRFISVNDDSMLMWIVYSCADGTVCDSSFRTSIELLRHTAEQHDNTNDEKVTGKEIEFLKETEEDMFKVEN